VTREKKTTAECVWVCALQALDKAASLCSGDGRVPHQQNAVSEPVPSTAMQNSIASVSVPALSL